MLKYMSMIVICICYSALGKSIIILVFFCISQYICTVYLHHIVRRGKKVLKAPQFIKNASGFIIIQKRGGGKKKRKMGEEAILCSMIEARLI